MTAKPDKGPVPHAPDCAAWTRMGDDPQPCDCDRFASAHKAGGKAVDELMEAIRARGANQAAPGLVAPQEQWQAGPHLNVAQHTEGGEDVPPPKQEKS